MTVTWSAALEHVRAAGQRMGQLIDDLLGLSRVTRNPMRRDSVDLSALAEEVVSELRRRDPERRVEAVIEPGLRADADRNLIRIVFENLLGNAWKFTRRTPDAHLQVGQRVREGRRDFFVRDNGAGFDMTYAAKLFGAFQRLHGESEFEGTGIGLATVQRIVHRHAGEAWAEGAINKGETFYFTLGVTGS